MTDDQMNKLCSDVAAIKQHLIDQDDKIDDVAQRAGDTQLDVAALKEKLVACTTSLDRVNKQLSNGLSDKVIHLEGAAVTIAANVSKCQKECMGKWKLLLAAVVTFTTGALLTFLAFLLK